VGRRRPVQLFCYWSYGRGKSHLVVVTTPSQIDHVGVMRVPQHAIEEPFAERFRIAAE
jgi:hypothetical protein